MPTASLATQIEQLTVPDGMLALWSLGQAGFVLKSRDTLAVIDPYLTNAIEEAGGPARRFPPPIAPDALRSVDVVFCTHEHEDHTDPATVSPLMVAAPHAQVITSPQSAVILRNAGIAAERITTPALGETHSFKGLRYTALPAAHYDLEIDADGRSRWMGFLIEVGNMTLVHVGDTILRSELMDALRGKQIDLALIPFNGRDYFREQQGLIGNLLPREATELAHELGAEVLIAMHNDLFAANRVNPAELWDDLDRRFPWQRCHLLQPGELYLYARL